MTTAIDYMNIDFDLLNSLDYEPRADIINSLGLREIEIVAAHSSNTALFEYLTNVWSWSDRAVEEVTKTLCYRLNIDIDESDCYDDLVYNHIAPQVVNL